MTPVLGPTLILDGIAIGIQLQIDNQEMNEDIKTSFQKRVNQPKTRALDPQKHAVWSKAEHNQLRPLEQIYVEMLFEVKIQG
jgi:hypothetical protein